MTVVKTTPVIIIGTTHYLPVKINSPPVIEINGEHFVPHNTTTKKIVVGDKVFVPV